MKRLVVLFWFAVCLPLAVALPHFDLEMTGDEYSAALKRHPRLTSDRALNEIINTGKRSLDWLKYINANRPESQKISFSSPDTQVGYPIDAPDYNSGTIVEDLFKKFSAEAPSWFADIVLKGGMFPTNPAATDADYISWGLRLDRIYQKTSRWLLMSPSLSSYAALRKNDVRGYYHLGKYPDIKTTLSGYATLPTTEKDNIFDWMAGLCANGGTSLSSCRNEFKNLVAQNKPLYPYYQKYLPFAEKMWNKYFKLSNKRTDVQWDNGLLEIMTVPFVRPSSKEVEQFLVDNIEEEWQFNFWRLRLGFKGTSAGTANIVFSPGATPHVESIGGNTITMDQNQPLTEYNVRWTIRHEYGHVLGFPDCYVEFYDSDRQVMVSYQLDITNLMCSRRGHIQATHYNETKDAYGRL